jgi:flagellar hook protein FlgE
MGNDVSSISLSGINAYSTMMNNTANNIANQNTDKYKPLETTMKDQAGGGVIASTNASQYQDTVDLSKEVVNMMVAENGIKANLQTLKTQQGMQKSVIDIIA